MRDSSLVFVNNIVTAIGGMLFWMIVARTQPPAVVGIATAGTTMIILLSGISQMGLGIGIIRYYGALGPHRSRRLAWIFTIVTIAAVLTSVLFWMLSPTIAAGIAPAFSTSSDALLFIAACAGWTLSVQYDNYLLGRRLTGLLAAKSVLTSICRIVLILMCAQPSIALIIAITGLSGLIGLIAIAPFTVRHSDTATGLAAVPVTNRELIAYSLWNYLSGLAGTLPSLVVPMIAVGVLGGAQAGAYYMAWTLFSALQFIPSALGWMLFAESSNSSDASSERSSAARQVGVAMALLPALFVPAALAVLTLLGPIYLRDGWLPLLVLAGGFWPYYRSQVLIAKLRVLGEQWMLTAASAGSHLAIVGASVPLLASAGTAGAALAWSLGQYMLVGLLTWNLHYSRTKERST